MEMKKRLRRVLLNFIELLSVGLVYYVLIRIFGVGIPCPSKLILGLYCPGCGVSRMCEAMISLDFHKAFLYNRFVFVLLPFLLIYMLIKEIIFIVKGTHKSSKIETIILLLVVVAAIVFGIMRNMERFSYLQPIG